MYIKKMPFPVYIFYHRSIIIITMMTDLENRIGDVRCMREEKMSRKLVPPFSLFILSSHIKCVVCVCVYMIDS